MKVDNKKLIVLLVFSVFMPVIATAEQIELHNPNDRAVWAVGGMKASIVGLNAEKSYVAVDTGTGKEYAVQLNNGLASIGTDLGPFEGKVLDIRPGKMSTGVQAVSAIRQQDGSVKVENAYYSFLLDASNGYIFTELMDKERKQKFKASFGNLKLKRKRIRIKHGFPDPGIILQSEAQVKCSIEQPGPVMVRIVLSWSCKEGLVREVITAYAGSRIIEYDGYVQMAAPLDQVTVGLEAAGYGSKAIVMPDGRRLSGRASDVLVYRATPCQVVGFDPEGEKTLGLLTSPKTSGTMGVYLCDTPEGTSANAFGAQYYSRYLAYEPVGTDVKFTLGLLIGGGRDVLDNLKRQIGDEFVMKKADGVVVRSLGISVPWGIVGQEMSIKPVVDLTKVQAIGQLNVSLNIDNNISSHVIQTRATVSPAIQFKWKPDTVGLKKIELKVGDKIFNYNLEVKKAVEIVNWWPDKLILSPQGEGTGTAVIKNNMPRSNSCSLRLMRITGIDEQEKLWQQNVTLLAGEQKKIFVRWQGGSREYGRELRLSLIRNGKLVDEQSEYTTLGDNFERLVQLTITNPGWFYIDGHQNWMIPNMRRGYTGTMEFYSWAPDTQYELAPRKETWEPHTDSQIAYRSRLSKTFLKNMINLAHQQGLKVVSWSNGMASLPRAMENPEEMMYTEDGQPWVYNRKVYSGDEAEFMTIYRDYYTKERILAWADEMIASIEMFDWDGVRFDCGFRPLIDSGDPFFQTHKLGDLKTYTFDGTTRRELYADSDTAAAEFTNLWRARVSKRYPKFRYHTNACFSEDMQKTFPKWTKATAVNGGCLLQEHMLYEVKKDTIKEWAKQLKAEGENLRHWGGQLAVGGMPHGPPGYSSLMHWISFASGYHVYAWAGHRSDPIDPTWKEYRFALRYAEYFYAPDMHWLPLDQTDVVVNPDKGIMWKNFVYKRQLKDGRTQYIVDMVNLPDDSDKMFVNHAPASIKTKTNMQVTLNTVYGNKPVKAWMLLPEPEPHSVALKVVQIAGKPTVRIDRLNEFGMIIFELAP